MTAQTMSNGHSGSDGVTGVVPCGFDGSARVIVAVSDLEVLLRCPWCEDLELSTLRRPARGRSWAGERRVKVAGFDTFGAHEPDPCRAETPAQLGRLRLVRVRRRGRLRVVAPRRVAGCPIHTECYREMNDDAFRRFALTSGLI